VLFRARLPSNFQFSDSPAVVQPLEFLGRDGGLLNPVSFVHVNREPCVSTASSTQRQLVLVRNVEDVRRHVDAARRRGGRIGLVPTMGALHAGHLSLIETARDECDFVVVTVFVNPAQFGPNEDLAKYPRPLETDLQACRETGVDLVFHPDAESMYPADFRTSVAISGLSDVLEGVHRPGHFQGVTTIVLKLFNIVAADAAYFGQKDFQQQTIIRRMCIDLDLPIEVRTCPTVREADGLALSSRNGYLSAAERQSALALFQSLQLARDLLHQGETDVDAVRAAMHALLNGTSAVRLDYATIVHPETFQELSEPSAEMVAVVAARVGETRLIDNLPIALPSETSHP